jgi:NAD(P)-dependent dehydrogenase (short-subunit alcohol dehydrogenase family)
MKTYLVTGAGSGIGRATAVVLSGLDNARIILIGRTKATLEETVQLMHNPERHIVKAFDIRESASWREAFKDHNAEELNLCGVFANAGTGGENHYGENDAWAEIISTNLTGTYVTVMEMLPFLKGAQQDYKNIVITSSCLARFGVPNYTAYCTAKTGLLGLTRSLALEVASEKILVNAILPGWVETDMAKASIQRLADRSSNSYEQALTEQKSFVPLNRMSQPEEIGKLIKFLFTNEQTSITGQGIDINNGSFMI